MFKSLCSAAALCLFCLCLAPKAHAYGVYRQDVRHGPHPYDQRDLELRYRKNMARHRHGFSTALPVSSLYLHPLYAERSMLHPFYRQGGTSIGDNYREWQGFVPSESLQSLNPNSFCYNYRFQRLPYRAQPYGYECY